MVARGEGEGSSRGPGLSGGKWRGRRFQQRTRLEWWQVEREKVPAEDQAWVLVSGEGEGSSRGPGLSGGKWRGRRFQQRTRLEWWQVERERVPAEDQA